VKYESEKTHFLSFRVWRARKLKKKKKHKGETVETSLAWKICRTSSNQAKRLRSLLRPGTYTSSLFCPINCNTGIKSIFNHEN